MHLSTGKEGKETTDFRKEVKKKLIDEDKTQRWLTEEVNKKLGNKSDYAYINRVINGIQRSKPVMNAISEILGISS